VNDRPTIAAEADIGETRGEAGTEARADAPVHASHAKLACGEAAWLAARHGIQVHGAMGYSWEVDVHFFLKRGIALTNWWGGTAFHRERVAARVFARPLGPEHTFAREA